VDVPHSFPFDAGPSQDDTELPKRRNPAILDPAPISPEGLNASRFVVVLQCAPKADGSNVTCGWGADSRAVGRFVYFGDGAAGGGL